MIEAAIIPSHATNYTVGRGGKNIEYIVIHYTGNDGDTARANANYFKRADRDASAHFFVDAKEIVQCVRINDTAYHAGKWDMNLRSLGVEMCSKKDAAGRFFIPQATIELTQELVRELMHKYMIPLDHVIRHYDVTSKACPEPFVRNPALWEAFKEGLKEKSKMDKNAPSAWAKDACDWAVKKGVFKGDENGDMKWQETVTREQLAVILHRLNGGA